MTKADIIASDTTGLAGAAPVLFLCEHASAAMPAEFGDLGLAGDLRHSHIAWDPGAHDLARDLARGFAAPLVAGAVSRLVYDCNRPPEAADAVPEKSETHAVPGNAGLNAAARADRVARVYRPFCAAVTHAIDTARPAALVTVHSFTPVYFGTPRAVEIGILHDNDPRLADAMLAHLAGSGRNVQRNAPYGPDDGVTHSLKIHALPRGLLNVMIEVRNDLLTGPDGGRAIADLLREALHLALADTGALAGGGAG